MSKILKIVLSLSLSGTILMTILFALKPLYKNRMSKAWQYYIWLIIVARMLLPFTPETTLVGSAFNHLEYGIANTVEVTPTENDPQSNSIAEGIPFVQEIEKSQSNDRTATPAFYQSLFNLLFKNFRIIWVAIALALLIRKITMYQSFVRYVKAGCVEISNIDILNLLAENGEQLGIKKPIELYTNSLISSPMLIGFFRPFIVFPNTEMKRVEMQHIMKHELTHFKRLDMLYKWLVQITLCLHWFNPFLYLMRKEINNCCELSCDEAIIRSLDINEKKIYGDTLLTSLKSAGKYKDTHASVALTESAEQIKERLDAIMTFKRKSKMITAVTIALTLFILTGAAGVGAYAAPKVSSPSAPRTPLEAMGDSTDKPYTYSQAGYYQEPYIFELGWNLNEKGYKAYSNKAKVKLSDETVITISFDDSCKADAQKQEVLSTLTVLIEKLNAQSDNTSLPLEKPLVVNVQYVGDNNLETLAEEYYTNNKLTHFSAIFFALDDKIQKEYCDRMFQDNRNAFFSSTLRNMNINLINTCAEKSYQEKNIAFFTNIVPYLNDNAKQTWITRASQDNRNNFLAVMNEENQDSYTQTTKDSTASTKAYDKEYADWNITVNENGYYYKGSLVRIFMDLRDDGSFENSFVNDNGIVDIKLLRNSAGSIVSVGQIVEQEAKEILDDFDIFQGTKSIERLTKNDLPSDVLVALNECTDKNWYVLEDSKTQYIYYAALPHDYSFQIDGSSLSIFDIGKKTGYYVLLAVPKTSDLKVNYNSKAVEFTRITL